MSHDKPESIRTDAAASVPQPVSAAENKDDEVDIDLGDPEVQKAAVFIQSSFKGFKQRKISQGLVKVDCRFLHYFHLLYVTGIFYLRSSHIQDGSEKLQRSCFNHGKSSRITKPY